MACFRNFLAVTIVILSQGFVCPWAVADDPPAVKASGPDGQPVDLPPAPEPIAALIEAGDVTFSLYDPRQQRRQYAGETQLDLRYSYRSTSRWNSHREGETHIVTVRPKFHQFEFTRRHTILLPIRMAGENFYSRSLVQHEFDHVRISTNPIFEKQFQGWIETELKVLKLTLPEGQALDNAWVQGQVKAATKQRFDRMLELIQIRYRELDRVTDHGLHPLPQEFFAQEK